MAQGLAKKLVIIMFGWFKKKKVDRTYRLVGVKLSKRGSKCGRHRLKWGMPISPIRGFPKVDGAGEILLPCSSIKGGGKGPLL